MKYSNRFSYCGKGTARCGRKLDDWFTYFAIGVHYIHNNSNYILLFSFITLKFPHFLKFNFFNIKSFRIFCTMKANLG